MTLPAILFGVVLSTAYGTAFHFWKGGTVKRLLLYILLAWVGFWAGHFLGKLINFSFASVGTIYTGAATVGAAIFLFAGEWLSRVEVIRKA